MVSGIFYTLCHFPSSKSYLVALSVGTSNMRTQRVCPAVSVSPLDIAAVTGKPHKDVLKAIRTMEPAWEKECGRNFSLTSEKVKMPQGGVRQIPVFQLTKTESLKTQRHSGTDPVVLVNKKRKRFFFCISLVFLYLCKQRVLTC